METKESLALCAELKDMIADGPGDVPGCLKRIEQIKFRFGSHPDGYVREKANDAAYYLTIWRSPRKWQQWGNDPSHLAAIVRNSVSKLDMALSSYENRMSSDNSSGK